MSRRFSTWKKVFAGLGIAAAALVVFSALLYRHKARPFEEVYASIKDQAKETWTRQHENEWEMWYWDLPEYIRGKAVLLDASNGHLDTRLDVPEELKASTPDEVGTIVLLKWEETKTGFYKPRGSTSSKDGPGAFTRSCVVTIIDRITRETIGGGLFRGSPPPAESSGPGYGSWPTEEVSKYLLSLPRKPMDWRPEERQWTFNASRDWVELTIPPRSSFLIRPERTIYIRVADGPYEGPYVLLPDGGLLHDGERKSSFLFGNGPTMKMFVKQADLEDAPVRVTVSVRPQWRAATARENPR